MKTDFIILAAIRKATHNFTTFRREQLEELYESLFSNSECEAEESHKGKRMGHLQALNLSLNILWFQLMKGKDKQLACFESVHFDY